MRASAQQQLRAHHISPNANIELPPSHPNTVVRTHTRSTSIPSGPFRLLCAIRSYQRLLLIRRLMRESAAMFPLRMQAACTVYPFPAWMPGLHLATPVVMFRSFPRGFHLSTGSSAVDLSEEDSAPLSGGSDNPPRTINEDTQIFGSSRILFVAPQCNRALILLLIHQSTLRRLLPSNHKIRIQAASHYRKLNEPLGGLNSSKTSK